MDAPQHFNEFSWTTHQIPIENLVGPGVIVNVKSKVVSNADYMVTKADLEAWEDQYGKIPDGATFDVNAGDQRGAPGELVFQTQAQDYSVNYMILDSEGKLDTTLNEFKVSGETGVTPSNTSTPDSWLQATVNGETKFIPLYS